MVEAHLADEGRVAVVGIARPGSRNSLDLATCHALIRSFPLEPPEARRCYLLYGTGTAFSAGADRASLGSTEGRQDLFAAVNELYERLQAQPLPIVAWVNGPAIGAGAIVALSCDLRIVAPGARLAIPGSMYGIALSPALVRLLARELGQAAARGVLLANRELEAGSLLGIGIAHGSADSLEEALEWTLGVAAGAPLVVRAHRRALQGDEEEAAEWYARAAASDDLREGIAASTEKRPSSFRGS